MQIEALAGLGFPGISSNDSSSESTKNQAATGETSEPLFCKFELKRVVG